jgi:uncharacterized protein YndB with AHSA1/START domain
MTDRIEKTLLLRAPRSRVWRALTDPEEFGTWFGVKMPPGPFTPGARVRGVITGAHPGYENLPMEITIEKVEPERLFSWRWHPGDVDHGQDRSQEPTTLVVFTLEEKGRETVLTVVESGFDQLSPAYRASAFRLNDQGWTQQFKNIERHVAGPDGRG